MEKFFEYFEIPYRKELDILYDNAVKALEYNGDSILDFKKLYIYTYL